MRHRVAKRHLSRDTKHRSSLLKNLLRALFERGAITTTLVKAKETQRQADKLIAKAQKNLVSTKRQLHGVFGKRDVVNTLVDTIAPLFPNNQKSGFSSIELLGKRRGDNALLVKLSLTKQPEQNNVLKAPTKKSATPKHMLVKKSVKKDDKPISKNRKASSPKKKTKE